MDAGLESIAKGAVDAIPETTPEAIASHEQKQVEQSAPATNSNVTDKNGDTFDSTKHKADDTGKPILTKTGKLSLKPGAKSGTKKPSVQSRIGQEAQEPCHPYLNDTIKNPHGMTEPQLNQAAAMGRVSSSMFINVSMLIGGEAFAPKQDAATGANESEILFQAFNDWHIQSGNVDLPPNAALCLCLGMYVLPRLTDPRVIERMKAAKTKLMKKKAPAKSAKAAQAEKSGVKKAEGEKADSEKK